MAKTIKAAFGGSVFTKTQKVFQWDRGDRLEFVNLDLPPYYEVHFANSLSGQATTVIGDESGVEIPPQYFVPGSEIYAWVYISDSNGGYTKCQATIPVWKRAQPSDHTPTPAQQDVIDQAITLLNEALETQITPEEKEKLAGIEAGAEVNVIEHILAYEPDPSGMDGQWVEVPIVDKTVELPDWTQVSTVFFTLTCDDYDDPFDIALSGMRVTSGPRWGEMVLAAGYPLCRAVATLAGGSGKSYVLRLTTYKTSATEYYEFTGRTEDGWEIRIHTPNPFSDPLNHWEIETFNASDRIDEVDEGVYTNSLEIGNIDELTTTDKSSLVAAINEVAGSSGGGSTDYSDLSNKPKINDVELSGNKSLADIGAGTYSKPSGGIPKTDLASDVQTSLGKADSALQSYTETDPTVPAWAKDANKPSYTASEVGAIAAPASPTSGDVLTYDGSAWGASAPSHQIPAGGNAGECLAKNSSSDYDLRWRTINDWTPAGLMRTAGGTAAKVAEWSFWSATQYPAWLVVTVGNSNTYAGAITLKVNGSTAYPIYINGEASSATNYTLPAGSYFVYFDGTKFDFRTDGKLPGGITGHADQDIAAPASPSTGDFLCWNGSAWAATTLAAWQGGNY